MFRCLQDLVTWRYYLWGRFLHHVHYTNYYMVQFVCRYFVAKLEWFSVKEYASCEHLKSLLLGVQSRQYFTLMMEPISPGWKRLQEEEDIYRYVLDAEELSTVLYDIEVVITKDRPPIYVFEGDSVIIALSFHQRNSM